MSFSVVQRIIGLLLMLFSISMLPPILVSVIYADGMILPFIAAFFLALVTGILVWLPVHRNRADLRLRDGFLIVVAFWTVLGAFGALPFVLATTPDMSITDALFESISGLTTTGATVITGLDSLPPSILYYRQQLQWLGGMGIIVLAVAILPMLGVGGMQLYRAETPGPLKDSKLTPRITETAKALWYIYLSLTVACAGAYWLAGMSLFDAISHAFSTIAIGGFSTHDASIGYFQNEAVQMIGIVFMVLAGANFALHFTAWRNLNPFIYRHDAEFRVYFGWLLSLAILVTATLVITDYYSAGEAALNGIFQVISFATTTGYTTVDYTLWPAALPLILIGASMIGGCAGSTAGGIKIIRALVVWKQGMREIERLVHPNAQLPLKIGHKRVPERIINAVWGFCAAYGALFSFLLVLLTMLSDLDITSALSAVAACMNNLGPGLGDVASNMQQVTDPGKWTLMFAMLLGRLEIFTLLVLFTPVFWRR